MQHLRVKLRWQAIEEENKAIREAKQKGGKYYPPILSNGDSVKELLVRSRYLLYSFEEDWTANQAKRASILFEKYPLLKQTYKLTLAFRKIYQCKSRQKAHNAFDDWKKQVLDSKICLCCNRSINAHVCLAIHALKIRNLPLATVLHK